MNGLVRFAVATLTGFAAAAAAQEPTPREPPVSGAVVSRAAGERVRFVAEPEFRTLALGQDLLGGDLVRTGATGAVGILFADRTVMRLHANTELLVNAVAGDAAKLTLLKGAFWARAPRDAADLTVLTHSAAAAIRGTDWALAVEEDGTTRLAVYDGAVELANPLGSVTAAAGEAAVAAPGAAPVKVQVANRREAEQMLFTLEPLDLLDPLADAAEALAARAPEDAAAIADYRRGLALMRAGLWMEAAEAFAAAAPALGPERAAAARWLAAFARVAAGEPLAPPEPAEPGGAGSATDAVGRGLAAALQGDMDAAYRRLAAEDAPSALAAAAQLAVIRDDEAAAAALVERLKTEAPNSVATLQAEADYLGDVLGDWAEAAERLRRAAALAPDRPDLWNALGLAEQALDHPVEAEAAFRRALAISPASPAPAGNLAILLLEQERVGEARAVAETLLAADPSSFLGLRALGRAQAQSGEEAAGRETLLKALAAQPAAAETSLVLAIAAYQAGDRTRALQELDAAGRLDPNDATVPLVRTVIALNEARAEEAIEAARRAAHLLRRQRRTGALLPADRQSGSYLAEAFSVIGLDDWARYTADLAYDPLSAASLFGEAFLERPAIGRVGPSAYGGEAPIVQGLLLEPLAASARLRYLDLLRQPFLDLGATGSRAFGDVEGWSGELALQGFGRFPTPVSFAATLSGATTNGPAEDGDARSLSGSALLGAQPAPRLGAFAILGVNDNETRDLDPIGLLPGVSNRDDGDDETLSGGLGASWRLGGRRFVSGFASVSALDSVQEAQRFALSLDPPSFVRLDLDSESRSASQFAGLSYRGEDGAGAWVAGVEALRIEQETEIEGLFTDFLGGVETPLVSDETEERLLGRAYVDRRQRLAPSVEAEAALALNVSDEEDATLAPRIGLAWAFAEGQWLRLAALREVNAGLTTLAPISTLGLVPILPPLDPDGSLWGGIVRWDGEFGGRLHLGLEHQSLRYDELAFTPADPLDTLEIPAATLHATSARADLRLGGGVGVHANLVHAESRIDGGTFDDEDLPETPEWTARAGLAFLFPSRLSGAVEVVWTSERFSGGEEPLDPATTLDAALGWETFDRRLAIGLRAENLLDAEVERPFGQEPIGCAVSLSASLRF